MEPNDITLADELARMLEISERAEALPALPHCLIAVHSVPFGRYYKMWDTKGRLIVYVSRGWMADLKRVTADDTPWTPGMSILPLTGIPVIYE